MRPLSDILEKDFEKYYCVRCELSWYLAIPFKPKKCPFRGHNIVLNYENIENSEDIPRHTPIMEMPEDLTTEDLLDIFTRHKNKEE